MAMSQSSLRDMWKAGQNDRLCPWEQALALAYREAGKELTTSGKPSVSWVARMVKRVDGTNPAEASLR